MGLMILNPSDLGVGNLELYSLSDANSCRLCDLSYAIGRMNIRARPKRGSDHS